MPAPGLSPRQEPTFPFAPHLSLHFRRTHSPCVTCLARITSRSHLSFLKRFSAVTAPFGSGGEGVPDPKLTVTVISLPVLSALKNGDKTGTKRRGVKRLGEGEGHRGSGGWGERPVGEEARRWCFGRWQRLRWRGPFSTRTW